jgi:putative transposase
MAQTLVELFAHVVFSTKCRVPTILPEYEEELYRRAGAIVRAMHSQCLAMNGTPNHVHMLVSMSKRIALADLVREVKKGTSRWMTQAVVAGFGWQDGYAGFSVSRSDVDAVIKYIGRQKEHHRIVSFEQEYEQIVRQHDIEFDPAYLFG